MAFVQCTYSSEVLNVSTSMNVILPENKAGIGKHPTLFLLHGLTDDHTGWMRRTSIERYAESLGLAVVMPSVDHSFYTDMVYGKKYWTFLSEELPKVARSFFPLSDRREDNFVAGLSMGGYGAFKWALRHPEQFAAAASLSGALDMANRAKLAEGDHELFNLIYGDQDIENTNLDLLWLLKEGNQSDQPKPALYQTCGTEDFLYDANQAFKEVCDETDYDLTTDFGPGDHEWGYWDAKIQDVLNWLPLEDKK